MIEALAFFSLLFAAGAAYGPDFHGSRNFIFILLAVAWLAGITWRRVHWSAALALGWTLFSAARVFAAPVSPFAVYGARAAEMFDTLSAVTFVSVIAVALPLLFLTWRVRRAALNAVAAFCFANCLYLLLEWIFFRPHFADGALLGNSSFDASLVAVTWPILIRRMSAWKCLRNGWALTLAFVVPIGAILLSRSNAALLAFVALSLAGAMGTGDEMSGLDWVVRVLFLGLLVAVGHWIMGPKFLFSNGRMPVWTATLHWWAAHANPWIGTGAGSYFILGPSAEVLAGVSVGGGHLVWMHNEWLQILFEQGAIGLALAVVCFGSALWNSVRMDRIYLAAALIAYGVVSLASYPLHLPFSGFLGALLIVAAYPENYERPARRDRAL